MRLSNLYLNNHQTFTITVVGYLLTKFLHASNNIMHSQIHVTLC